MLNSPKMSDPASIVSSFEEVVLRHPDLCAVRWEDGEWSYAELNSRANRLAHFLIQEGVRPETLVGVFALRSPQTLVAFLAILKAGGAYVSLDPAYPPERTTYCIEDAAIQLILCDPKETSRLPRTSARALPLANDLGKNQPETNPKCESGPHSAAHVFYTSGSTGQPKGVVVEHRGVLRLALHADYVELGPGETLLQFTPLNYDVSTFEIWAAWLTGACLGVPPAGLNSLHDIGRALESYRVSLLLLPSSLLPLMLEHEIDSLAGVRQLMVGGDVVSPLHAEKFLRKYPNSRLLNAYGPTENTVITTAHRVVLENPMPPRISIGRPIPKTGVLILDEDLAPVRPGEIGEIVITGEGLARGYLNQPQLTRKLFVEVADASGQKVRAYRTGDFGCYNADGTIDFRGRKDEQVKMNGVRIELGEIKSILLSHPGVAEAEVLMVEESGEKCLKTFTVAKPGTDIDEATLREFLQQKIPANWHLSAFRIVRDFPRGPSGKVDRKALLESFSKEAEAGSSGTETEFTDPLELAILKIWRELLPAKRIGRRDRYADLGGDSLSALRMMARVERIAGNRIGLRPLLEGGTIPDLAAAAREAGPDTPLPLLRCVQGGTAKPPFFFAHGDFDVGGLYCRKMAEELGAEQPLYVLAPHGTFGSDLPSTLEEAAAHYVKLIRAVQPKGPYHLGGYCNGALVMYEVASQLTRAQETVAALVLLDPPDFNFFPMQNRMIRVGMLLGFSERQGQKFSYLVVEGIEIWTVHGFVHFMAEFAQRVLYWPTKVARRALKWESIEPRVDLEFHYHKLLSSYERAPYAGCEAARVILRAQENRAGSRRICYWSRFIPGVRFEFVSGAHLELQRSMPEIAAVIRRALKDSVAAQPTAATDNLLSA